jgi:hypothetical protein
LKPFAGVPVIGCFFHWKQAIYRKLLKYGIPEDLVVLIMEKGGVIEILTLIDPAEIPWKG